jgi:hypothetical protein
MLQDLLVTFVLSGVQRSRNMNAYVAMVMFEAEINVG